MPNVTWTPVSGTLASEYEQVDREKCTRRDRNVDACKNNRIVAQRSHRRDTQPGDDVHRRGGSCDDVAVGRNPDDLVAALAAISLVWVIETRKPSASVGGLAALYLYSGGLNAWRILRRWHELRTSDYIGILAQAIIPALACLVVGVWWTRRSDAPKIVAP